MSSHTAIPCGNHGGGMIEEEISVLRNKEIRELLGSSLGVPATGRGSAGQHILDPCWLNQDTSKGFCDK